MNCERVDRLLGVIGELDRAERRTVAEHLRTCDACRLAWRDELRVRDHLRRVPVLTPPPGLRERLEAIPHTAAPPAQTLPAPLAVVTLAVLSGLLLVAIGLEGGRRVPGGVDDIQPAQRSVGLVADADPAVSPGTAVARERAAVLRTTATPWPTDRPTDRPTDAATSVPTAAAVRVAVAGPPTASPAPPPTDEARAPAPPTAPPEPSPRPSVISPVPSAAPSATATPPHGCVVLTVSAFADVAGAGPLDCPGCDGQWGPADRERAAELGLVLPAFQVVVLDADARALAEAAVTPDGPADVLELGQLCGTLPLRVELFQLPPGWTGCPNGPGLTRTVDAAGARDVRFPLSAGCPAPSRPSATPAQAASPTPSRSGAGAPTPAGAVWTPAPPRALPPTPAGALKIE